MTDKNPRPALDAKADSGWRKLQIVTGKSWYQPPPLQGLRDIILRGYQLYGDRDAVRWRVRPRDQELVSQSYRQLAIDVAKMQGWL